MLIVASATMLVLLRNIIADLTVHMRNSCDNPFPNYTSGHILCQYGGHPAWRSLAATCQFASCHKDIRPYRQMVHG